MSDGRSSKLLATARSLDDLLGHGKFVVIGANSGGDQVRAWLAAQGKHVISFADLDPQKSGTERAGLKVHALADLRAGLDAETAFVIGTVRQHEAATRLIDEAGIPPGQVFPFVNGMFSAHYQPGTQAGLEPHHARVRALLSDAESRSYFDRVTAFYRTLDSRHLTPNPNCIGHYGYRAAGANPAAGTNIVDCGAFTGDTFEDFLQATGGDCHIYALEAFMPNLERLFGTIAAHNLKERVTVLHVAAARAPGAIIISGDATIADGGAGTGERHNNYSDVVLAETLDNLFLSHLPRRIDYLKMDIEGADLEALQGAERLLRTQKPVVAVAAYHQPGHIVEIADYLSGIMGPCRIYAGHDPAWIFHIHYIVVPESRL